MTTLFNAFISYGRADSKAFAQNLQARLTEQGFNVWFDFNDIPLAVDFQNQIDDGIEKASHFLFIIAPHSVNSPYCLKEIELAIKLNKRIIPILHVMEISQETWQQRNPNGTESEWQTYKEKGLHESYQNMHPTIRKLNWVYFQEGINDFDASLADLVKLLRSHTDYVEKHTRFLVKALEWERNQKQHSWLLIGEERQQAEAWLKVRFKDEQPPCLPTDLHCEYITESIKNANNLMTQVIIAYSDADKATMEKIRRSLRRESITVWTNTTDIKTGEAFEEAIKRGIEQADNLVYLISPDAVNSTYCQQELDLAVSLHKRIIPVLVRETSVEQIPPVLQGLQYIDLTDNVQEDDYLLDESQLLRILHQDEAYYREHKILLTKALKWQEQYQNPSILLRGYNLRSAEAWLKVAKKRTQHPPIALQEEYITESQRQPPLESLDVFISYSRADSDLARKLNNALQMQGKTTWFDQESIASGSDFKQEIQLGIKACDNFLFILSPRSVNSPYCKDEVEYAASLNKRFVTVLHQPVNSAELHPELAKTQWIDFNQNQREFNANFNQLVRALETDREHVHLHSKWSHRALEWQQQDKSEDLLLRGNELAIAQDWLQETNKTKKKPSATELQNAFIQASLAAQEAHLHQEELRRKRELKQARRIIVVSVTALIGFMGLTGLAVVQLQESEERMAGQLDALIRFSQILVKSNLKFDALIEGIRAGALLKESNSENSESKKRISQTLQTLIYEDRFRERNRL
ncbi:MAG: toll/interleukin-1 receptor domain-containing protein, partial [Coleofasciculus sp.]